MPLSYPILTLSPVTNQPVYPWIVENHDTTFPSPVQTGLNHATGIKLRISTYLQKSKKLMRDNIKYIVFVVFEIEYMSTGISKFSHSVLSVLHSVKPFLDWGLDKCWLKSQTIGIWIFIPKPEKEHRREYEITLLLRKVVIIIQ